MNGVRGHQFSSSLGLAALRASTPGSFALEQLERRAAAGGELADPVGRGRTGRARPTESPPPTTVVASVAAIASATACVPAANGASSNAPIGPFQKHRAGPGDRRRRSARRPLRPDVEAHPAVRHRRSRRSSGGSVSALNARPGDQVDGSSSRGLGLPTQRRRRRSDGPRSSHERVADLRGPGPSKNGEAHRAADQDRGRPSRGRPRARRSCPVTFAAAERRRRAAALGSSRMPLRVVTSRSSRQPRGARQQVRDALVHACARWAAPKRVVDVHLGQRVSAPASVGVVLRLALRRSARSGAASPGPSPLRATSAPVPGARVTSTPRSSASDPRPAPARTSRSRPFGPPQVGEQRPAPLPPFAQLTPGSAAPPGSARRR